MVILFSLIYVSLVYLYLYLLFVYRPYSYLVFLFVLVFRPHCSAKVLRVFDQITEWYLTEDRITTILQQAEYAPLLDTLDKSLRAVIERY